LNKLPPPFGVGLRLDSTSSHPLRHFRCASGAFAPSARAAGGGAVFVPASGSAQMRRDGVDTILRAVGPGRSLVVVDLREESHGYLDGNPVAWIDFTNGANAGKQLGAIRQDEERRLGALACDGVATETEAAMLAAKGVASFRIPVTDRCHPSDEAVDRYLALRAGLPDNAWVHFHCKQGKGRTTSFLAMEDMLRNASTDDVDTILARQRDLGGQDLLHPNPWAPWFFGRANAREAFLRRFHAFAASGAAATTTWSAWSAAHP
jgi:hypothetical protein